MRGWTCLDPECGGSPRRNCAVLVANALIGIVCINDDARDAAGIMDEIFSHVQTYSRAVTAHPSFERDVR